MKSLNVFKDTLTYKIWPRVCWILLYQYYYSINYSVIPPPTPFGNKLVLIVVAKLQDTWKGEYLC